MVDGLEAVCCAVANEMVAVGCLFVELSDITCQRLSWRNNIVRFDLEISVL